MVVTESFFEVEGHSTGVSSQNYRLLTPDDAAHERKLRVFYDQNDILKRSGPVTSPKCSCMIEQNNAIHHKTYIL